MDRDRVVLAEISGPRGNKGELLVFSQSDVPGRIENLSRVQVRLADGTDEPVQVTEAWAYRGDWVLKLSGVDSITQADRFRGAEIWVPMAERARLPAGEHFQSDLVGCSVIERDTGRILGVVDAIQQFGGSALLELTVDEREVLVPFVDAICPKVDLESRTILVDLPDGLLEL